MNFSDNFFRRVERKTNVDKGTILDLAKKLQETEDFIKDIDNYTKCRITEG